MLDTRPKASLQGTSPPPCFVLHPGDSRTPLATVVPDSVWPGMWRVILPGGQVSPPFDLVWQFVTHALKLATGKVAMMMLTRRLNAAHWLRTERLARVYLISPRPSMPPGPVILAGEKPGGGQQDFVWLVFDRKHERPELRWLTRDGVKLPERRRRA